MTLAKHNLHTAALIPGDIAPTDIIAALHDHNTCLSLQALTTQHKKLPTTSPDTLKDTYWYPTDIHPVTTYSVTEVISFLPFLGDYGRKYINFPSCFQDTPYGIKTRADASGVIVRGEFRVIPGGSGEGEVEGEGEGIGDAAWVLVEDVEVQCAWYMMPFVRGKMEQAHREIVKKVVEKVVMQKRQDAVASSSAKGKARMEYAGVADSYRRPEAEPLPEKITYG